MNKLILYIAASFFSIFQAIADDGHRLWLRYDKINDSRLIKQYENSIYFPVIYGSSATIQACRAELQNALSGLTGKKYTVFSSPKKQTNFFATLSSSPLASSLISKDDLNKIGTEGFLILTTNSGQKKIIITAKTDIGLMYGIFHFLRLIQTNQSIEQLHILSNPRLNLRLLNHWDNLNRTVERGYAGFSIWDWHKLPGYIDKRYIDYARANASVGINGTVLNNVNANSLILTKPYLLKVKALADVFRPYGIKVYLTAKFSSPIEIGDLQTADPLNDQVQNWWKAKAKEIYSLIPDFGGFLVKANSEGQPGPQDYKRTHADGANMLAAAVAPYNGIVIWRAFVYSSENTDDRHKQAYDEFLPLDGKFSSNVMLQVKNGAIDFMPREPFHPLFGAMPKTPLMMEFQLTQEYTGQGTSLVYLAPLFKEVLNSDTYSKGKGSTVGKVVDGSLDKHLLNGMAGVSNIGNDMNWCGHPFAQANWYAYGRLCWDYNLSSEIIADEWLRMTLSNNAQFVAVAKKMMMSSRETMVNYMNPLGLHHIMRTNDHYGPAPWVDNIKRPEWNPVYYHKADSVGIGFNRSSSGSNAIAQYKPEARIQWENITTCDEKLILWFHHVPWSFKMKSGRTLWDELCFTYYSGADDVKKMQHTWSSMQPYVDAEQFDHVKQLLNIQYNEAVWWRNSCLLYFQTFSKMPIPTGYEQPDKPLEYYKNLKFYFVPGI